MHMTAKSLEAQLEKVRELEGRLTFRLSVLSKTIDQQSSDLLKDTPLSLASYRILAVVGTFEEISISDISRFNAVDRAQVSRTAVDLAASGYVAFQSDPGSKRKKIVVLTEAGRALLDSLSPKFETRRKALKEGLGEEANAALWQGLDKLAEIIAP